MENIKVEVCCQSVQDVIRAKAGGASRVELCSSLFFGGLTPSCGTLIEAKRTRMEIMAMVRPREGGFFYQYNEFKTMLTDARLLLQNGADGIVFGLLREDCSLDYERCREMMEVIGDNTAVFHRAIDLVGERWRETIDMLCELGVRRILTSGQRPTAFEGRERIRQMREYADGRIEILPGGGIRPENVRQLLRETGCDQVHTGMSADGYDNTVLGAPDIHFTATSLPAQNTYRIVDPIGVSQLVEALRD